MREDEAIRTDGKVSYYAAASTVVCIETPFVKKKVCRIEFSKRDGSIMVPFPYLNAKRGLLSDVTDQPPDGGPYTYHLARNGVVVSYDVKFNHHRSGVAHFSKDGPGDVLPRRRVFPLVDEGFVFQLHVHSLTGLDWVTPPKKRDLQLNFSFKDGHPLGIRLHAVWRKKDLVALQGSPPGVVVGPRSDAFNPRTREALRFAFIGQPDGFAYTDHVLLLSVHPVPPAKGTDVPTMIFLGALNQASSATTPSTDPGFLAFMYPYAGTQAKVPQKKSV